MVTWLDSAPQQPPPAPVMADPAIPALELNTEVSASTASSISVSWSVGLPKQPADDGGEGLLRALSVVTGFQVHYQKVASTYLQHSPRLPRDATSYNINNLVADTYYKVCVVLYRNDTLGVERQCLDANTTSWHIPVSIGSSIGAVLALSIIVLIVLLSRCPSLIRHQRASASESSKYDSMTSSRYHDDHHDFSDTTTHCGHDHDDDVFTSDVCDSHPLESSGSGSGGGGGGGLGRHCSCQSHHNHYPPLFQVPALPERLLQCNGGGGGGKNHVFLGLGSGVGGGHLSSPSPRHIRRPHGGSLRTHSLSSSGCARTNSLERTVRQHRQGSSRRAHLQALHSAHQSIQSEPGAPPAAAAVASRSLHVSISDLPPAVHISDPKAPVASLCGNAVGAGAAAASAVTAAAPSPGGGSGGGAGTAPAGGQPAVAATAAAAAVVAGASRPKASLKDTPRTFHMSIDLDV